ncbi:TRAM domain-containing protein [Bacillus sp. WP8]
MVGGYRSKRKVVNFKGGKEGIGKMVKVKMREGKSWCVEGEMVGEGMEVN